MKEPGESETFSSKYATSIVTRVAGAIHASISAELENMVRLDKANILRTPTHDYVCLCVILFRSCARCTLVYLPVVLMHATCSKQT